MRTTFFQWKSCIDSTLVAGHSQEFCLEGQFQIHPVRSTMVQPRFPHKDKHIFFLPLPNLY